MNSVKGLHLEDKTLSQQLQIRLLSRMAFMYLHHLDIASKKHLINYNPKQSPVIYALWHGSQWGLGVFPQEDREKLHILISLSNDGEIISRVCHFMGFSLIRGSQKRGGEQAIRDMLSEAKGNENIVFMVDGPKGPKQKVKKGIIRIAKMAKIPIVPIMPYTPSKICVKSWDNYEIPINFFTKASLIFGDPITVPEDADDEVMEKCRLELENKLFELEKDAKIEYRQYWGE